MSQHSAVTTILDNFIQIANQFNSTGKSPITVILTFLLTLTLGKYGFGLVPMGKNKKTGEPDERISTLLALILAIYTSQFLPALNIVEEIFPSIGVIIIGFTVFSFVLYFMFPDYADKFLKKKIVFLVMFGIVMMTFWQGIVSGTSIDATNIIHQVPGGISISGFLITNYDISLLIVIGGFIWLISWILSPEDSRSDEDKGLAKMYNFLMKGAGEK